MKNGLLICLGLIIFGCLIFPLDAIGQEVAMPISHENMTKQAIRDRVKVLRQARHEKMPYLHRAYIRSSIRSDKIEGKIQFLSVSRKSLKEIINRAIQVSSAARASHEQISLQKRRILLAMRELFPEVELQLQNRYGALSSHGFNSRFYKFSFRQPAFRGGILWNSFLQEKVMLEASEKEYEKIISDLINDVSGAYLEFQRASMVMKDQKEAIDQMLDFFSISKQKFDQELASEIEHLNVDSLYSQMGYDYETSKQEWELAKLELQKHLNLEFSDELEITSFYDLDQLLADQKSSGAGKEAVMIGHGSTLGAEFEGGVEIPNLDILVDLAYQHRAELQVEAAKLEGSILEERIRWGEMLPHVDLVLEFGKLGEAFNVDAGQPGLRKEFRLMMELTWNAGGNRVNYTFENDQRAPSVSQFAQGAGTQVTRNTLSIGLLDGLDAIVEAKEAKVAKLDQIVELENAEKEVIHDVKQAYYDYQKALIQVQSTLKRVDYRERLARLSAHRLSNNEVQISEYLQAEIDLLNERTELHEALRDYFIAKAELNRALGMQGFLPLEETHGK